MLRSKHSGWTWEGKRTPYFGGGGSGGGGTTTSTGTTYQTNIPEYAQPYVETMLGATQKQLFDMDGSEITGFKPYKPYSTDLDKYTAGFQPLQEQAMRSTGQLRTPGQFGDATTLAGAAGLGSLGAGQQYARNVTDPSMMQSYMSPYQQNVTDIAKMNAVREAQMAQNAQNLGAARQGTYGGARQTLMQAEREKNLLSNLSNIQAQGSQSAFDRATQAQQFGSTLGMQGYGQAGQAASTLGQLGGQQLGAQKEIIGLQSQLGAQQQALEQQKINQAIQEYANAQQYPIMQLGVMSNMLRGLPMQATQTQTYAAAPNPLTQGIGTVGALGSLANVFKGSSTGREGGLPSEFKPATGIKSYDVGGGVKGKLYDMEPDDLRDYIKETSSPIAKRLAEEVLRDKVGKASGGIIAFKEPNEENNQGLVKSNLPTFAQDTLALPKGDLPVQREENQSERTMREYRERIAAEEAKGPKLFERFKNYLSESQKASGARALDYSTPRVLTDPSAAVAPAPNPNAVVKDAVPASDMRTKDQIIADANKQNAGVQADPNLSKEDKARLQKRHDEGVAIVKANPNIGVKPPAPAPAGIKTVAPAGGPVAAAPDTKLEFPTTGNPALDKYFKDVLEKASKPPETVEEEIAKKEKYLGPDDSVQKERARLMAAKSNIRDEKFREFNMNAALFFAEMATKPGNVAFAALTALKNTIPTFIASDKEKGKLFREIDKGLVDLDKAARLEKSGDYDKAREIIAKRSKTLDEKIARPIAFFQAENVAKIGERGKIKAAEIGLEGDRLKAKTQTDINRKQYAAGLESDQKLLQKIETDTEKTTEHAVYLGNKRYVNDPKNKDAKDFAAKQQNVKDYETKYEEKTRPIREQINFYRKELGLVNPVGGEGKKDTANNKLTMDGYVFPDQTSLDLYKAAKAKQKG